MRIGGRKLVTAAGVGLTLVAGLIAWQVGGLTGLILVLLTVLVFGLSALGFLVAQTERRIANAVLPALRRPLTGELQLLRRQTQDLGQKADDLAEEIEALKNRVERPGAEAERLLKAISAGYKRLEAEQGKHSKHMVQATGESVARNLAATFRQYEALTALYLDTGSGVGFPATRSWVASPDLLHYLYQLAARPRFDRILECGSGLSTVIMAYGVREKGTGCVVALEHLEQYAEQTSSLVDQHGLGGWVDLRLAPLEDVELEGEVWPWYRLDAVPDQGIDLLMVDGPPGNVRPMARYPALPLLYDRLAPDSVVILDDYKRDGEAEIADRWTTRYPDLSMTVLKHEKGTARFKRPPTTNP